MIRFELGSDSIRALDNGVAFQGMDNGFPIDCAITTAALVDLWGGGLAEPNWLNMFEPMQIEIFELAQQKYERRDFEPDGSILIDSGADLTAD